MNDPALARAVPLRDQIHARLRAAIVMGEYPAGAPLIEAELAARLGASRTPVREALQRLETEGLVERRGVRGIFVRGVSEEDVTCVFEIREALESLAARRACRRISPTALRELSAIIAQMHAAIDNSGEMERLDTVFHERFVDLADGARLQRMLSALRAELSSWRVIALATPERRRETVADYEAIVQALANRDEDAARRSTAAHIARTRVAVLSHVRDRPAAAAAS